MVPLLSTNACKFTAGVAFSAVSVYLSPCLCLSMWRGAVRCLSHWQVSALPCVATLLYCLECVKETPRVLTPVLTTV